MKKLTNALPYVASSIAFVTLAIAFFRNKISNIIRKLKLGKQIFNNPDRQLVLKNGNSAQKAASYSLISSEKPNNISGKFEKPSMTESNQANIMDKSEVSKQTAREKSEEADRH